MAKRVLITVVVFALIAIVGGYFYFKKSEPKTSLPNYVSREEPSSDFYYYHVVLNDGREFYSKVNNYTSGNRELYQAFINDNGVLKPYFQYREEQQRMSGKQITNYENDPKVTIKSSDINKLERLPDESEVLKAIEEYIVNANRAQTEEIIGNSQ